MILRCHSSGLATAVLVVFLVQLEARRLPFGARRASPLGRLHEAFVVGPFSHSTRLEKVGPTSKRPRYELWESLRGGAVSLEEEESDEEESDDEETDDEEEIEEEEEEGEEVSFADTDSKSPLESVMSMEPVTLLLKTVAGSELLDHSIEVTVNRSRNVASLKQSLSRQLPGKPPIASMQLVLQGKVLDDDVLVQELVDDEEDEEEDEEEEAGKPLVIQVDMIPPVDPKFAAPLQQRLPEMTVSELLEAYALNEAAMYRTAAMLYRPEAQELDENEIDDEEEESTWKLPTSPPDASASLVSEKLRQDAARIRSNLESTLLQSPKSQALLAETESPLASSAATASLVQQVRGERVRVVTNNSAAAKTSSSFSRSLQHHLNIHWGASIRTALLFVFFGWFGGRTPLSKALLLFGAPAVFIVQARTVKAAIKEVAYAILKNPVGIVLSLLPAPQQAILSLDVEKAMETLYGDLVEPASLPADRSMEDVALDEEFGNEWATNSDDDDDERGVESVNVDTDDEQAYFDAEEEENWDEEDEDEDEDEEE